MMPGVAAYAESPSPEQQVKERAEQRWQALIQGDVAKAYEFLSPAYRQAVSLEMYQRQTGRAVRWTQAEVKSVICQEKTCSLEVSVDYHHRQLSQQLISTPLDEKWILVNDRWWYFQEK